MPCWDAGQSCYRFSEELGPLHLFAFAVAPLSCIPATLAITFPPTLKIADALEVSVDYPIGKTKMEVDKNTMRRPETDQS